MKAKTCLIVALPAEARPVIRHFGLQRLQVIDELPVYTGHDIALVISGVGKRHAASATALLSRCNRRSEPRWINYGIAGHATLPIGQPALAHAVIDDRSNRRWPLSPPALEDIPTHDCRTVENPVNDYPDHALYEMEAAGILETIPDHRQIQILKIISDNALRPGRHINAKYTQQLCQNHMSLLERLVTTR